MLLKLFRILESIFGYPADFFEDLADARDTELHERLRIAMKDMQVRELYSKASECTCDGLVGNNDIYCPEHGQDCYRDH